MPRNRGTRKFEQGISPLLRKMDEARMNHREDWQHNQSSRQAETSLWIPENTKAAWNSIPKPKCCFVSAWKCCWRLTQFCGQGYPAFVFFAHITSSNLNLPFFQEQRQVPESRADGPLGFWWHLFISVSCIWNDRGKDKTSMSKHTDLLVYILKHTLPKDGVQKENELKILSMEMILNRPLKNIWRNWNLRLSWESLLIKSPTQIMDQLWAGSRRLKCFCIICITRPSNLLRFTDIFNHTQWQANMKRQSSLILSVFRHGFRLSFG